LFAKSIPTLDKLLKATLLILVGGVFGQLFKGGSISSLLFMNLGLQESVSVNIELGFAFLILFMGLYSTFIPKVWSLYTLTFLLLLIAIATHISAGKHYAELSVLAQFARLVTPLSFCFLIMKNQRAMVFVLRLGLSITFLTHGWEALQSHPVFIDYVIGFSRMSIEEGNAVLLLKIIGFIDISTAILIWFNKTRQVLYWMIVWGFATAFVRLIDAGADNFAEFMVRVPNFMLAYVLLIFQKKSQRRTY